MSEKVDEVAQALLRVAREKGEAQGYDMTPVNAVDLEFFEKQARAAIETMRVPTEAMIEVGRAAIREFKDNRGEVMDSELAELAFRAMTDEALK